MKIEAKKIEAVIKIESIQHNYYNKIMLILEHNKNILKLKKGSHFLYHIIDYETFHFGVVKNIVLNPKSNQIDIELEDSFEIHPDNFTKFSRVHKINTLLK